uniref:TIR domain-containing protein n=1 Tax=Lotus japonicus TaxID=34305 RepID=I3S288_LOTJA|nr:unknown [Lotus japonicus]
MFSGINFDEFSRRLSKMNINAASISLDEEYRGLISKRSFVLSKIETDGVENERIHDDVRKWLNEVEKVVKDVDERKASKNAGTMDDEWSSTMIKKIQRLYEERNFPEYYIPRAYFYYPATPAIKPISIKTQDVPTPPQPPSVEEYASRRKVGSSFTSKEAPNQQLKVEEEDDACHKSISCSSTTPLTKSISSAKSMSSNSTEEAFSDDTFVGLQVTSGDFMYLGSRNQAKNILLNALQDDRYHSIGLFGKRGSGKTTLVEAEIPEYENIFHLIVSVTVSEQADIVKLQNQIAHQLNLKLQAIKSKYRRASAIKSALLKSVDKVLVIFDDVSTNFGLHDIEDIGIPDPSKQCKVLLITHDKMYCNMIRCNPWIPLHPLSNEDAWKLLQQYSGIDNDSPSDLINVAREVAFLCIGLPRVIKDVVSALHKKDTKHWKETLDCLNHSTASHQIFVSFRGKDTRDDFTASLFDALVQGGFKVFKDDEQLRSGDQVSEALVKAIEQSRKKMKQLVLPIFYKVDPTNVRYVKGSFGEAMTKKKERFKEDTIQEWTSALFEVSDLSGRDYKTGRSQVVFIKEIVQYVRENIHRLHIV